MSKLPNAPLVEVIFELRWGVQNKEELDKHQYLHGDLYAKIKDRYGYRESLKPQDVPMEFYLHSPNYRFRVAKDRYPLLQVGPGIFTINTNDTAYEWSEYKNWCIDAIKKLYEVFELVKSKSNITLILQYQDFLTFDFENNNIYDFLKESLHTEIKQSFYNVDTNPYSLDLKFNYKINYGNLEIHFQKVRKNDTEEDGILIKTLIANTSANAKEDSIFEWLDNAHKTSSQIFKNMMEGKLYDSFK